MAKEKILLVEDDQELRKTCAKMLTKSNYQVEEAANGLEAIEKLTKAFYDLVITDLRMPEMDGLELLKRIKNINEKIPVVIMTAHGTISTAIEALKSGAYDYLLKPFTMDEFISAVNRCIEFNKTQRELFTLKEIASIYEIMHMTEKVISEEEILKVILEKALQIAPGDSGSIMLYNDETQELEVVAEIGLGKEISRTVKLGERISGKVLLNKKPIILHDGLEQYPELAHLPTRPEIVSSISLPLIFHDKVVGVMNLNRLNSIPYNFTESELHKIEFFASYATNIIMQFKAYKKFIELERQRSEFTSNISHELRTPLMSISGAVELLEESTVEQQRQLLPVLKRNIDRLNKLIIALLDLNKLETGRLEYYTQPTDMVLLMKNLAEDFKLQFETKKIDFTVNIPEKLTMLNIDQEKIRECIGNLLSNALKFTEQGGKVKFSVSELDKELIVSVEDTGIGIPKEHIGKIFDRFYQVNGSSLREYPGAGIGLTIAKEIALAHKGRIWVESEPGKGSKFYVALPKSM